MARVLIFLIVCFLCLHVSAARRRFRNEECISSGAKLNYYNISSCSTLSNERCPLVKKENVTLVVDFTPFSDVKNVEINVFGKLVLWIPFQISKDSWKIEGDLKAGMSSKLVLTLQINPKFPTLNIDVKFQINGDGKNLICFIFPAKIVNNP